MPGYCPSALGAATKVRIVKPWRGMSAYSVVTTICVSAGILAEGRDTVNPMLTLEEVSNLQRSIFGGTTRSLLMLAAWQSVYLMDVGERTAGPGNLEKAWVLPEIFYEFLRVPR